MVTQISKIIYYHSKPNEIKKKAGSENKNIKYSKTLKQLIYRQDTASVL